MSPRNLFPAAIGKHPLTKAEAYAEADRRGWTHPILFDTNNGIYAVAGYSKDGRFHCGASEDGWEAAFRDADWRDKL